MPLSQRLNNPLAPAAFNGLSSITPDFEDLHLCKSWAVTLNANQILLNQAIPLDTNADYFWFALTIKGPIPNQPFAVRFSDSTGYEMSDSFISSMLFTNNVGIGAPYVNEPVYWLPAGSSINVDLIEQSGATNGPIYFLIQGLKRFK